MTSGPKGRYAPLLGCALDSLGMKNVWRRLMVGILRCSEFLREFMAVWKIGLSHEFQMFVTVDANTFWIHTHTRMYHVIYI